MAAVRNLNAIKKLSAIQQKLRVGKDEHNDFGNYYYRTVEGIVKKLKPLCDEAGCVCYMTNDLENIGDRNYVKATVHFVDIESGEEIISTAHAREEETKKGMDQSQITGASSSYARKYALAGLFCIDNESDSDATNGAPETAQEPAAKEPQAQKSQEPNTELPRARAKVLGYANKNYTPEQIKQWSASFKVASLADLNLEQCKFFIKYISENGGEI